MADHKLGDTKWELHLTLNDWNAEDGFSTYIYTSTDEEQWTYTLEDTRGVAVRSDKEGKYILFPWSNVRTVEFYTKVWAGGSKPVWLSMEKRDWVWDEKRRIYCPPDKVTPSDWVYDEDRWMFVPTKGET